MIISEGPLTISEFHDPWELLDGLDVRIHESYRPEQRNLIVLEDLSREWVEALGHSWVYLSLSLHCTGRIQQAMSMVGFEFPSASHQLGISS